MDIAELVQRVRRRARPTLREVPVLRKAARALSRSLRWFSAAFFRIVLTPFGRSRRRLDPGLAADQAARTDTYNEAAEKYFRDFEDPGFLRDKPFSEPDQFAARLFNLGILFRGVRLSPGDVVVDFGAGSCWLSHFLHRFGCPTYSVDVSETALEIGRQLFEGDSRTDWELDPRFVSYDGYSIPLPDACCDKVVIHDAFHHVPNQRQILGELFRILRPRGIVGMREPGQDHSSQPVSVEEASSGVLENDIVVEELAALATDCGFARTTLIPASAEALIEIDAADLGAFQRGKEFVRYWSTLCSTLQDAHFLFLHKDSSVPTTRSPGLLSAEIWTRSRHRKLHLRPGEAGHIELWLRNSGDTIWLGPEHRGQPGWARLGGHLTSAGHPESADHDWLRIDLPGDIEPRQELQLDVDIPALDSEGRFDVVFEMVVEGRCWFGTPDQPACRVELVVESAEGDASP